MDYKEVFTAIEDDGAYMTPKIARKVMAYFQMKENKLEKLTKREIEFLKLFHQREGEVVSRDEILDALWKSTKSAATFSRSVACFSK